MLIKKISSSVYLFLLKGEVLFVIVCGCLLPWIRHKVILSNKILMKNVLIVKLQELIFPEVDRTFLKNAFLITLQMYGIFFCLCSISRNEKLSSLTNNEMYPRLEIIILN